MHRRGVLLRVLLSVLVSCILLTAQGQCFLDELSKDLMNSKTSQVFKDFIKGNEDALYAYKKLYQADRVELRKSTDALFIYSETIKNPKLRQLGFTDEILARVKGSKLDEGGYVSVMTDIDRFGKVMAAHPTIEFDNFGSLIGKLTDGNPQNTQAAHWILQDLVENVNDFVGKRWSLELSVKNSDNNYAFIDLANDDESRKFIEYKWLTSNVVAKEDFIREFIKRDLFSDYISNLSQVEWRIKGHKLTKAKVQEYLNSSEGQAAIQELGVTKVQNFFRDNIFEINRNNFVSFFIKKFNEDEVFNTVFK